MQKSIAKWVEEIKSVLRDKYAFSEDRGGNSRYTHLIDEMKITKGKEGASCEKALICVIRAQIKRPLEEWHRIIFIAFDVFLSLRAKDSKPEAHHSLVQAFVGVVRHKSPPLRIRALIMSNLVTYGLGAFTKKDLKKETRMKKKHPWAWMSMAVSLGFTHFGVGEVLSRHLRNKPEDLPRATIRLPSWKKKLTPAEKEILKAILLKAAKKIRGAERREANIASISRNLSS